MKRKNWKKTAAFVTSLTMATTMMPAEIGSVLVHALPVAGTNDNNGTKNVSLGDAAPFVTGVKISDATKSNEFNATLIAADADKKLGIDGGKTLEITSKFPLKLFENGKSYTIGDGYERIQQDSAEPFWIDKGITYSLHTHEFVGNANLVHMFLSQTNVITTDQNYDGKIVACNIQNNRVDVCEDIDEFSTAMRNDDVDVYYVDSDLKFNKVEMYNTDLSNLNLSNYHETGENTKKYYEKISETDMIKAVVGNENADPNDYRFSETYDKIVSISEEVTGNVTGNAKEGYKYTINEANGFDYDINVELADNINEETDISILQRKYIKSLHVKSLNGEEYDENLKKLNDYTGHFAYGDVVTIESTALLDLTAGNENSSWNETFSGAKSLKSEETLDGTYEYQFIVLADNITIRPHETTVIVPVKTEINGTAVEGGTKTVIAGLQYKVDVKNVAANKSVNVTGAESVKNSLVTNIIKEKNDQNQETGTKTYTSTFTAGYENVSFEIGPHIHQRKYTVEGSKVYVECTSPEKDVEKSLAAELKVDFGKMDDNTFVSTAKDGSFVYDGTSAIKPELDIKSVNGVKYIDDSNNAVNIKFNFVKKVNGEYVDVNEAAIKDAGSYKVVCTFKTKNEKGIPDDISKVEKIEKEFVIQAKEVTNDRITFKLDDADIEYKYNQETKTFQVYTDGYRKVTPKIYVDNIPIQNTSTNNTPYYAVGTTTAKYANDPGKPYVISLISNDPNNTTNGDLEVKWEIVVTPYVNFTQGNDYGCYYTGSEDDVLTAVKDGISSNTTKKLYFVDRDITNQAALTDLPDDATTDVPVNAGEYTVIASYTNNQKTVYSCKKFEIKAMPIRMEVKGHTEQLEFGQKQTVASPHVLDIYGNDISTIVLKRFVNQPVIKVQKGNENSKLWTVYNPYKSYEVGDYTLHVSLNDAFDSGNKNYTVDANYVGIAGNFKVLANVVKDFSINLNAANIGYYHRLTEEEIAEAYITAYPGSNMTKDDVEIIGGLVTAKNITGKYYNVTVEFKNNFRTSDGESKSIKWRMGAVNPVSLKTFEPEYREDLKACTVVATVERADTNAAIKEWGLIYDNKGIIASGTDKNTAKSMLTADLNTDTLKTSKFKKQASANVNNSKLTVTMANSFVDRDVYAVPYVVYEDGSVEFNDAKTCNYFDLIFDGLKVTQSGSTVVKGTNCVTLNIKRDAAKGYTVTDFGYVYSNTGVYPTPAGAQNWLDLDNTDSKNCRIKHVDNAAETLSYNATIANSKYDTTEVDASKRVYVYAKAFVTVKDKNGTSKTFLTDIDGEFNQQNTKLISSTGIFYYNAQ